MKLLYTTIHICISSSESQRSNSKFWSLEGSINYTEFQPVIKSEVTASGGLALALAVKGRDGELSQESKLHDLKIIVAKRNTPGLREIKLREGHD